MRWVFEGTTEKIKRHSVKWKELNRVEVMIATHTGTRTIAKIKIMQIIFIFFVIIHSLPSPPLHISHVHEWINNNPNRIKILFWKSIEQKLLFKIFWLGHSASTSNELRWIVCDEWIKLRLHRQFIIHAFIVMTRIKILYVQFEQLLMM
jgi:hypothetical protein